MDVHLPNEKKTVRFLKWMYIVQIKKMIRFLKWMYIILMKKTIKFPKECTLSDNTLVKILKILKWTKGMPQ